MQDIFHQESFSEIRKEDGKLRTHSLFKDTIGIEKYIYTIRNVEERNIPCQVNMSSYLYHPFIHSFWFISLISFPGLRGLFPFTALNVIWQFSTIPFVLLQLGR